MHSRRSADFQPQIHVFGSRVRGKWRARRELAIHTIEDNGNRIRRLIRDGDIEQPSADKIALCSGDWAFSSRNGQRSGEGRIAEAEEDVQSVGRFAYDN